MSKSALGGEENKAGLPLEGTEPATGKPCLVVGIGASAGGQDALEQLFTAVPSDCGVAFVVIMHLPPKGPSFLAEALGRYTPMKVATAEEGMAPRPDTVHVIPAGRELSVSGGRFRLEAPADRLGAFHPVDRFFRSLASEMGERSIAVILSGSGTDGAEGVTAVRGAGGIVIVQEPGSAIHPAMPQSAISTGAADLILPPEELAEKIAGIARGTCLLPSRACRATTLDEDLADVFAIVKARTGHDFSSYKRNTVVRRVERRMAVNDVAGMRKYIALLETNEQEAQALGQEILIGVTSFFRDPEAFEALRREVIPRLFANRDPDDPVRIWHACCSTGEEVYSTAILIREYLNAQGADAKVQLFATDIDETAIAQARAGLYFDEIEEDVGEERLKAFFTRVGGRWQVAKQLREMVVFAHHSLIKDPPFSRLDLLVCRNFLIYLNPDMQKRLMSLFHLALKPQGSLFLGAAETAGRNSDLFASIDKKWKIYERLEGSRREDISFPFTTSPRRLSKSVLPPRLHDDGEPNPGQLAEKLLLERYSPPCVLVNEKYEVVHVSTRANRFLEVPVGEPTRDILKMAREELRPALRAAIYKAFTEQQEVVFRGMKVPFSGEEAMVNVLVGPLKAPPPAEKLVMVILEPVLPPALPPQQDGVEEGRSGEEASKELLIRQLEEQLRVTHEQLQAVTDQLETSNEGFMSANEELMSINEEFQSANEELQSTNEELETSKEELQALNEELATVNTELQGKVEELDRANSDLENLFRSSEIATIFLDRELTIKRYSPAMASIFNLIPADIGRPFRHLAGTIDWHGLPEDARTVLASLIPVEREVATLEGQRHYLMRVLPYRATEGRVDGIVVTLVDITERKRSEEALRRSEQRLKRAQEIAHLGSWELDLVDNTLTWSDEVYRIFGLQPQEFGATYEAFLEAVHPDDLSAVDEAYSGSLREGRDTYEIEHRVVRKSTGEIRFVHEKCEHFRDGTGRIVRSMGMVHDITERKRVEKALQKAHDELELRVRERTAELREKDQLLLQQSRQAAMGEMINNIAHQWRQPLNGLGLIIQSLPMICEMEGGSRDYLESVEEKAMQIILHMSQTIDDFRNYFQPDKEKVRFHVNQPVSRTINLIEEGFRNLKIAIEVNATDDPVISGYPNEFAQVLLNILINAKDAFVERKVGDPKISIAMGTENGRAFVTIADNAGGIPEDIMDKIFEPYFTTKGPDKGTGIGLFMSKTIIEKNMGGRLAARNTVDGAEFRIEV